MNRVAVFTFATTVALTGLGAGACGRHADDPGERARPDRLRDDNGAEHAIDGAPATDEDGGAAPGCEDDGRLPCAQDGGAAAPMYGLPVPSD